LVKGGTKEENSSFWMAILSCGQTRTAADLVLMVWRPIKSRLCYGFYPTSLGFYGLEIKFLVARFN
jgi:hypothetical protein